MQVGIALSNLASVATALGRFPQALAHRERAEAIRRRQNDASALPYDLANRADLLIRLGRFDDAAGVLDELDAGIKSGIDAYVGRARRAAFLRALAAVIALRPQDAIRHLRSVPPSGAVTKRPSWLRCCSAYAQARLARRTGSGDRRRPQPSATVEPALARERQYWLAATAIEQGKAAMALAEAERGLALLGEMSNDELRWRLAALGTLAFAHSGETDRAREMRGPRKARSRVCVRLAGRLRHLRERPDLADSRPRLGPA